MNDAEMKINTRKTVDFKEGNITVDFAGVYGDSEYNVSISSVGDDNLTSPADTRTIQTGERGGCRLWCLKATICGDFR